MTWVTRVETPSGAVFETALPVPLREDGGACIVCVKMLAKDGRPCRRHGGPARSTSAHGRRARRMQLTPTTKETP